MSSWIIPSGFTLGILIVTLFLRWLLYNRFRMWASRTKSCWDDIIIKYTRLASLFWCFWLAIFSGQQIAVLPSYWQNIAYKTVPVLFVALGIFTGVVIVLGLIKWYRTEICPTTAGMLDDYIMAVLAIGVPVIAGILGTILILGMLGYENLVVNQWLGEHGGRLALLAVLGVGLLLMTVLVIPRFINSAVGKARGGQTEEEVKKRAETLSGVITTTVQVIIIVVFAFMILSEIGLNIAPMLAGVSVVGIAIGFGAQSLVKDIIAGMFIIMENQYRKGDVAKIADVSGVVEDINLRRTVLRDMDGVTHVIPNGEIRVASNYTKEYSRVNLNIAVSYDTDLDRAMAVINRVGKELAEDPKWRSSIVTPPQALRVDKLGDSGIEIKVVGDTKPMRQWDVTGELRLRLKREFDKERIEIPWPHTKVFFGNALQHTGQKDSKPTEDGVK
jgi:moderate conductance mechanosensitive channel